MVVINDYEKDDELFFCSYSCVNNHPNHPMAGIEVLYKTNDDVRSYKPLYYIDQNEIPDAITQVMFDYFITLSSRTLYAKEIDCRNFNQFNKHVQAQLNDFNSNGINMPAPLESKISLDRYYRSAYQKQFPENFKNTKWSVYNKKANGVWRNIVTISEIDGEDQFCRAEYLMKREHLPDYEGYVFYDKEGFLTFDLFAKGKQNKIFHILVHNHSIGNLDYLLGYEMYVSVEENTSTTVDRNVWEVIKTDGYPEYGFIEKGTDEYIKINKKILAYLNSSEDRIVLPKLDTSQSPHFALLYSKLKEKGFNPIPTFFENTKWMLYYKFGKNYVSELFEIMENDNSRAYCKGTTQNEFNDVYEGYIYSNGNNSYIKADLSTKSNNQIKLWSIMFNIPVQGNIEFITGSFIYNSNRKEYYNQIVNNVFIGLKIKKHTSIKHILTSKDFKKNQKYIPQFLDLYNVLASPPLFSGKQELLSHIKTNIHNHYCPTKRNKIGAV